MVSEELKDRDIGVTTTEPNRLLIKGNAVFILLLILLF